MSLSRRFSSKPLFFRALLSPCPQVPEDYGTGSWPYQEQCGTEFLTNRLLGGILRNLSAGRRRCVSAGNSAGRARRGRRPVSIQPTDFTARVIGDDAATFPARAVVGAAEDHRQSPDFAVLMEHPVSEARWLVPRSTVGRDRPDDADRLLARQSADPEGIFEERLNSGTATRATLDEAVPVRLGCRTAITHRAAGSSSVAASAAAAAGWGRGSRPKGWRRRRSRARTPQTRGAPC